MPGKFTIIPVSKTFRFEVPVNMACFKHEEITQSFSGFVRVPNGMFESVLDINPDVIKAALKAKARLELGVKCFAGQECTLNISGQGRVMFHGDVVGTFDISETKKCLYAFDDISSDMGPITVVD